MSKEQRPLSTRDIIKVLLSCLEKGTLNLCFKSFLIIDGVGTTLQPLKRVVGRELFRGNRQKSR